MIDTIGDKYVPQPIVIHIEHKSGPTPVRGMNTTVVRYFREAPISVIQLECILDILLVKVLALFQLKDVISFEFHNRFNALFRFRKHIRYKDLGMPVVIDVCHINTHGRE